MSNQIERALVAFEKIANALETLSKQGGSVLQGSPITGVVLPVEMTAAPAAAPTRKRRTKAEIEAEKAPAAPVAAEQTPVAAAAPAPLEGLDILSASASAAVAPAPVAPAKPLTAEDVREVVRKWVAREAREKQADANKLMVQVVEYLNTEIGVNQIADIPENRRAEVIAYFSTTL